MKITQFGENDFVVNSDNKPIFELKINCSKEDLRLFDDRELYAITRIIFNQYKETLSHD